MSQPKSTTSAASAALTVFISVILSVAAGFMAGVLAANSPFPGDFLSFMPMMGGYSGRYDVGRRPASQRQTAPKQEILSDEEKTIATVKKATPAVVSIIISKDVPIYERQMVNPFAGNDFFGQFFGGMPQMQVPQYQQKGTEKQKVGAGSGFIVSADGYVVTNRHVVADQAAEYTAVLADGRKFPVKVLARDPSNDVAVLKIDGKDLPVLAYGDSDSLQVGQRAIAIGYALGEFGNTVSSGIISGLKRSLKNVSDGASSENLFGVIQTDAAINPGNSGGPLLNLKGQVIGVDVAIVQGSQNIGFALPINDVRKVVDSVRKDGRIVRPFLGVRFAMIDKEIKESNQLTVDDGALIVRGAKPTDLAVLPGSPADKAGLLENDIILEANGQKLNEDLPLDQAMAKYSPGDKVTLKILRKGEEQKIVVTLEEKK